MLADLTPCQICGAPIRGSLGLGLCPACALRSALAIGQGSPSNLAGEGPASLGRIGDYELIEEIGRGGMGVVFLARQRSLNRRVALKLMLGGVLAGENGRRRLLTEAAAAGRLRHPGIVAVHEAGLHDGQPYFSMEWVEGRTLAETLRSGAMPERQAVELLLKVAEAVEYAHGQGVLHRDLKPANILIDHQGEPRITDFGLAKVLDRDWSAAVPAEQGTLAGQVLGSPAYMSPEQASGAAADCTPASDVYSLGTILYELLVARPPFVGQSPQTVLAQVLKEDAVPLRRLNASIPPDLETICLKCLEKEPGARYPSAQALADDLRRYLNHEPVQASPIGSLGRLRRWGRRNPLVAALATLSLGLLLGLAVLATLSAARIKDSRDKARQRLVGSLLSEARLLRNSAQAGHRQASLQRIQEALRLTDSQEVIQELRREAIAALTEPDLRAVSLTNLPPGADYMITHFDPDFQRCVLSTAEQPPAIYRVETGQRLQSLEIRRPYPDEVMGFSPDGRFLLLRYWRAFDVLDAATGRIILATNRSQHAAGFSPDSKLLARAEQENTVAVHALADLPDLVTPLRRWAEPLPVRALGFSPDSRELALADESAVWVRDWRSGAQVWEVSLPARPIQIAWSGSEGMLAVACRDNRIIVLNATNGSLLRHLNVQTDESTKVVFTPDGKTLACTSAESGVQLFEPRSGRRLIGHPLPGWHAHFDAAGRRLGSMQRQRRPSWIELDPPRGVRRVPAVLDELDPGLQFSADGSSLFVCSSRSVQLWDAKAGRLVREWPVPGAVFTRVWPDEGLALISRRQEVLSFVLSNQAAQVANLTELHRGGNWFWGTDLSPDRQTLAVADHYGGEVRLLSLEQPGLSPTRLAVPFPERVAFSPDGRWLAASAFRENYVQIWDWKTKRSQARLARSGCCLKFSKDGRLLLSYGRTLRLWDTGNWSEPLSFPGTEGTCEAADLSVDGRWLAAALGEGRIHLINTANRQTVAVMEPPGEGSIRNIAFHPSGKGLVLARGHAELQFWDFTALRRELGEIGLDWAGE